MDQGFGGDAGGFRGGYRGGYRGGRGGGRGRGGYRGRGRGRGRGAGIMRPQVDAPPGSSVYVGNLSWSVNRDMLRDEMVAAGEVLFCEIMMGHDGRSRGCAIVVFSSPEEARNAISMFHDTEMEGRKMLVREDREEGTARSRPPPRQNGGAPSIAAAYAGPQGSNVYVGNLPWSVTPEGLTEFMQSAGGEVAHAEVLQDGMGRSKGCGIVRFANAEQARNAIETLNESELEGRFIIVREDREEQKFRNAKACKVTGLPGDVTWQRVKDNFRNAGDILHVDVFPAEDGTSNATVRFADEMSANNAVDIKNGVDFEGTHTITVVRE